MRVGKLVRDRIPEIIEATGVEPEVRIIAGDELLDALFEKLSEEAQELRLAEPADRVEEFADVIEELCALAAHLGVDLDEVEEAANRKRIERGGFVNGLWLSM